VLTALRLNLIFLQQDITHLVDDLWFLDQRPNPSADSIETIVYAGFEIQDSRLPAKIAGDLLFGYNDDGLPRNRMSQLPLLM
jgi:hypothetical protein